MTTDEGNSGCPVLDEGRPPAFWVDELGERGIPVSERTVREWASTTGFCYRIGRTMLITTDQMNRILEGKRKCPSSLIGAATRGGRKAASNSSAERSRDIVDAQLERLKRLARGDGAMKKRTG